MIIKKNEDIEFERINDETVILVFEDNSFYVRSLPSAGDVCIRNIHPSITFNKEVDRVLEKIKGGVVLTNDKDDFVVDSEITVEDGPFTGFVGIIEKVDADTKKLIVKVSIFGRMTPVELRFDQVKK